MKIESNFRQPTQFETGYIRRLLTADFQGKQEISNQLNAARVRVIDDDGSLEFEGRNDWPVATAEKRIPVEGEAPDADGILIHFLLHTVKGLVKELEIYKDDGSPIMRAPKPDELRVIVLPPSKK
jgi:uncharacterized protein DUF6984